MVSFHRKKIQPSKKKISNPLSDQLVHQWRSEEMSIMIGTLTALKDNPLLTVRFLRGNNPIRIVIDKDLKIPSIYRLFNSDEIGRAHV